MRIVHIIPCILVISIEGCRGFHPTVANRVVEWSRLSATIGGERREILRQALLVLSIPTLSAEASDDLTSQLFNSDGSLKDENTLQEAKSRPIDFVWDSDDETKLYVSVDGKSKVPTASSAGVSISYSLPQKWDDSYIDSSQGVNKKACSRIIIYRLPGIVEEDRLARATRIGVSKALQVTDELKELSKADLIGGRTSGNYYEFDMAIAPSVCGSSQDNLGLGFCPYEDIFLVSSTIADNRLYVFCLQAEKEQWKRAGADLRRVRSSFTVETPS